MFSHYNHEDDTTLKSQSMMLNIAKAITIVLVVIGHYYPQQHPYSYTVINKVIYMFHMPLFMLLSGFIYSRYSSFTLSPDSYRKFVFKKFKRLMIPYFVTSVIVIGIKMCTDNLLRVDHPATISDFVKILYLPSAGYFLWFVWALWWMMLIIPFFNSLRSRLILLAAGIFLYFISDHVTEIFCLQEFCKNLIYFVSGVCLAELVQRKRIFITAHSIAPALLLFGAAAYIQYEFAAELIPAIRGILTIATAFAGITFTLGISAYITERKPGHILRRIFIGLSYSTFIIYLFHTTFEGFTKAILDKLNLTWSCTPLFYADALIVSAVGVIAPYILYKNVLIKFNLTRKLFGLGK